MSWSPGVQDIEDIRPFVEVAGERGYNEGNNAEDMAVGDYNGQTVFLRDSDSQEAFNYVLTKEAANSASSDIRVPQVEYDEDAETLITEELGGNGEISNPQEAAESLINIYGFQVLIGQGDFNDTNTEYDGKGAYAFDFENIGRDIRQIYSTAKEEAQILAEEMGIDEFIDNYDKIGKRAGKMAREIDSIEAVSKATERTGENRETEEQVYENFVLARAVDNGADPESILEPTSAEHDDAEIIT
jgi:hypothetical protein